MCDQGFSPSSPDDADRSGSRGFPRSVVATVVSGAGRLVASTGAASSSLVFFHALDLSGSPIAAYSWLSRAANA